MPGLVPQSAPRSADRGDHDHDQGDGARSGQQHAGVVGDQFPPLAPDPGVRGCGVAQGDQYDVREHQVKRGESDPAVTAGEHILTPGLFQPRNPGHQQHLDEQQISAHQTREPTEFGQRTASFGETLDAAVVQPQGQDRNQSGDTHRPHDVGQHKVTVTPCVAACGGRLGPGHHVHAGGGAGGCRHIGPFASRLALVVHRRRRTSEHSQSSPASACELTECSSEISVSSAGHADQMEPATMTGHSEPNPRLLLVEDDRTLGPMLVEILSDAYHVHHAVDGQQGLHAALSQPFEVLVVDRGLPGIEGVDLVRRLRSRGVLVPVLILTARGTLTDRVEGLDAGAEDYLIKPFDIDELLARLRALLRRNADAAESVDLGRRRYRVGDRTVVDGDAPYDRVVLDRGAAARGAGPPTAAGVHPHRAVGVGLRSRRRARAVSTPTCTTCGASSVARPSARSTGWATGGEAREAA